MIVPFCDTEAHIHRCVESLRGQDFPRAEYEILMVDNNSTDASAAIVERYPDIRLLREPRPGAYAARNLGVRESRGEILAFTDPDCEVGLDWLSRIRAAFDGTRKRVVLGIRDFSGDSFALSLLSDYESVKDAFVFASKVPEIYYGYTNNMAVTRDVFEKEGPFLERMRGSDTAFVQAVVARHSCDAISYDPELRVHHLELDSVAMYLRKVYLYGRSRREFPLAGGARSLNLRERFMLFERTTQRKRVPVVAAGVLLALLGVGWLCWTAGDISGRLRSRS